MAQVDCPYCRRKVSFLVIENQNALNQPDKEYIGNYNHLYSEERSWLDQLRDIPFLFRTFLRQLLTGNIVENCRLMFFVLGGILYVISPFDAIPEAVFGIVGLIDDFAVVIGALIVVTSGFRNILLQVNNRELRA